VPAWWKIKQDPSRVVYDPLKDMPDGPIRLTRAQAAALRAFDVHRGIRSLFLDTPQGRAEEYAMDKWARSELLIDPYNRLTRKARASLIVFDAPPPAPKMPPHYRHETPPSRVIEDEPDEEDEVRAVQRIRVEVNGETLSISVGEEIDGWFAETLVPNGSKRRKRLEQRGSTKEITLHELIHRASAMLARAHVRLGG
jgi:hypothetical protein